MPSARETPSPAVDESDLRTTIDALAPIYRASGSPGERAAAEWITRRLTAAGCEATVEEEAARSSFWWTIGGLSVLGVLAARLSRGGLRIRAAVLALLSAAGIADEISNGPRRLRSVVIPANRTWNVTATTGDPQAERTVIVLAHHDAAHGGLVFHPKPQQILGARFPDFVERTDTGVPMWLPVFAAPVMVAIGALLRSRRLTGLGRALGVLSTAAMVDIGARRAVPGANDNLTGVAGLVALAEAFRAQPLAGVRVLLVSCGSEEALQEGIRPWVARHRAGLPAGQVSVINLETVGSPRLALVEGEGTLLLEDYPGDLRDLVAECADQAGITLRRNQRARASTDSVITARAGWPTATLTSFDANKALSNYHQPSDVPENVDYGTVADAARLAELTIRRVAGESEPVRG